MRSPHITEPTDAAHAAERAAHPEEFAHVHWISAREAGSRLGITKAGVRDRIRRGRWPLGHARLRMIEGQPRPQWEVTLESLTDLVRD